MHSPLTPPVTTQRDLRLDLFRGIALWLIFLDHIPSNLVSWITIRNYGFSDATEIFIFISGYTAAFVYGKVMLDRGFLISSARILRRAWQIYVAHIFLFAIYLAEISYVARSFDNPLFAEEMNILDFLKEPDTTIIQALLLKFKPVNMDVLPLYIILMLMFPPILWLLLRRPTLALGGVARLLRHRLEVRPEPARLSGGRLVLQSVRLAAPVRVRRLVRTRRSGKAYRSPQLAGDAGDRHRLSAVRVLCRVELALAGDESGGAGLARRVHLSDRQDQSRRAALRPFPGAGGGNGLVRAASPGRRCSRGCSIRRSCAASIRSRSSASGCSWPSPAISPWSRSRARYGCSSLISALGILTMVATAWLIAWYKRVEERRPGARAVRRNADLAGGEA